MNREDIIRMAREAGLYQKPETYAAYATELERFAALVAAAAITKERDRVYFHYCKDFVEEAVTAEREACAKVAGELWQRLQDTKDAHERNSPEPFMPGRFGFDQSTVQQSRRIMDAIRARGQA